jgi:hypothetical protein
VIPSPLMPTDHIVSLLIAERDKLSRAIDALQGSGNRPRPPKSASSPATAISPKHAVKKKGWTAAQKRAQAERMKAHWAKRKAKLGKR